MTSAGLIGAGVRVWACVIGMLLVSVLAGAAQAQSVGQATKVRGEVLVTRAGADQPVAVGMALQLRDTVKTGAKARAQIQFADGSTVTLGENSALSIDRFSYTPGSARNVALSALSGIVNAVATKSGEGRFDYQIKTGQGYSAVRGTHWVIAAGSAASTFYVVEGLVEVGTVSGGRSVAQAGTSVTVSSEGGMGAPQPIPPDILNDVTDATDPESANAAPAASDVPADAPADQAPDDDAPSDTPSAPDNSNRSSGGGGSGGGGGGHGGM